jgi:hypothetical protein
MKKQERPSQLISIDLRPHPQFLFLSLQQSLPIRFRWFPLHIFPTPLWILHVLAWSTEMLRIGHVNYLTGSARVWKCPASDGGQIRAISLSHLALSGLPPKIFLQNIAIVPEEDLGPSSIFGLSTFDNFD